VRAWRIADSGRMIVFSGLHQSVELEPSKAARKRCKGVTRNGTACTNWAMEGGLCYFHANPNKASELGRNGGRHCRLRASVRSGS